MPYEYVDFFNTDIIKDCEQTIVIDATDKYRLEDYKHLIIRNFDQYLMSRNTDMEKRIINYYYKNNTNQEIYPTIDKIIKDLYTQPYFPNVDEVKIGTRFCDTFVKIIFNNNNSSKQNCIAYTF